MGLVVTGGTVDRLFGDVFDEDAVEGKFSSQQKVHDHAQTEHVDLLVEVLSK